MNSEPEPLSFVFERLVILRAAHQVLTVDLGMEPDIADLLETAAWLAGDDIDGDPVGITDAPGDVDRVPEGEDGTGA